MRARKAVNWNAKTRCNCFVLLRLRNIRTTAYIQCSNLRQALAVKASAETASAPQPGCPLRGRKRPWHRRSIAGPSVRSSAQKLYALRLPSALLRFFKHLHEGSTTYKKGASASAGIAWPKTEQWAKSSNCNHYASEVTPVICGVNLFMLQLEAHAASEQMPELRARPGSLYRDQLSAMWRESHAEAARKHGRSAAQLDDRNLRDSFCPRFPMVVSSLHEFIVARGTLPRSALPCDDIPRDQRAILSAHCGDRRGLDTGNCHCCWHRRGAKRGNGLIALRVPSGSSRINATLSPGHGHSCLSVPRP